MDTPEFLAWLEEAMTRYYDEREAPQNVGTRSVSVFAVQETGESGVVITLSNGEKYTLLARKWRN